MRDARATAERLGERMREATPPTSLQQHLEGRARLIASVERMRGGRARPVARIAAGLAAAAACALVVFVLARRHGPAPLAWHVVGGGASEQGYVSVPPAGPAARLAFDDGSEVALAAGSRGRVAATSPTGAEIVLEQGRARVHVRHRPRAAWTIDAGPYAVHVTGTEFLVAWAADAEVLDVWMHSGRVVVTGPMPGETLTLGEGQHLSAHLRDRTVQIDASPEPAEGAPEPTPTAAPTPAPAATTSSTDESPASPGAARSFGAPPPSSRSWSKLVAAGDYARVVREAEAEGMARAMATRPLPDLRALGDAARYAGRADVAKRAYSAVRGRFPASADARTAAFLIGRVEEEQDHAPAQALRWYDAYLAEAPGGAYAGDALGRKMIIVSKTQGRDAARPLADRYLQRYSGGPYAAAARDLAP